MENLMEGIDHLTREECLKLFTYEKELRWSNGLDVGDTQVFTINGADYNVRAIKQALYYDSFPVWSNERYERGATKAYRCPECGNVGYLEDYQKVTDRFPKACCLKLLEEIENGNK